MKTKKSLVMYFSVVALLVVVCYGFKTTFAYFIANEQGTATNMKVEKLNYVLESADLKDNAITLKPNEVKKINIILKSDYDIATIYRLNYTGNVVVEQSSTSLDEVKNIIDVKGSKNIDLVITNNSLEDETVVFSADGGYVGNELENSNIVNIFDEGLLQNKLLVDGTLTLTELGDYRDLVGTNNYVNIDNIIYRVMGVFKDENNAYLKLITNDSIGLHLFGKDNNYLTSSLNTYLNVDYKESLNKVLKDNLKEVTYYTAGNNTIIDKGYYNYERGELISLDTFNISGKSTIGLMYLSDYEYANNWLRKNFNELTIVPNTSSEDTVFCINYKEEKTANENNEEVINQINEISSCKVNEENNVRAVMYVSNNLVIGSGTGTEVDPYVIKLDAN